MLRKLILAAIFIAGLNHTFLSASSKELFVVITPEKTGTHLLTKAITLMTGMEVENLWGREYDPKYFHAFLYDCEKHHTYCQVHLFPNAEIIKGLQTRHYKIIFLMRDPRDQLMSTLFYIRDRNWTYRRLDMQKRFGQMALDEQIDEMITGKTFNVCIPREVIGRRLPWMSLERPPVLTVYYENLVGPEGGGTKEAQIAELTSISEFLHLKLSQNVITAISQAVYGSPGEGTFNIGKIGTWKTYFNELHKDHFKEIFGPELISLGYEQNYDW